MKVRLADWLDARRDSPWPSEVDAFGLTVGGRGGPAPASELYERYVADVEADPERRVLSHVAFGRAVKDHRNPDGSSAFKYERQESVRVYHGLTVATRRERFEAEVRTRMLRPFRERVFSDARTRHDARLHDDGSDCHHSMDDATMTRLGEEAAALAAAVVNEAAIRAEAEERYAPWLQWRPGDENPQRAINRARWAEEEAILVGKLAQVEARIAASAGIPTEADARDASAMREALKMVRWQLAGSPLSDKAKAALGHVSALGQEAALDQW